VTLLILLLTPMLAWTQAKSEAFIIQISDRSMNVTSPENARSRFSIIVDNRSLSDQVGRFSVNDKILKYISVRSGTSETVELENKSEAAVTFFPISPAFQEVELKFGKKAYEIPSNK
jgi:hypothetical protein